MPRRSVLNLAFLSPPVLRGRQPAELEVLIGRLLSLISQHAKNTIVDAMGRSNGVDIDSIDNAGLANVVVTEFFVVAS